VHNLAVTLPNWLGDAVMATPLLSRLRSIYPDSFITYVGKPAILGLFTASPQVDELRDIDNVFGRERLKRTRPGFFGKCRKLIVRARNLREGQFDSIIILPGSIGSATIPWLARIPERMGYAREGRGILLTKSLAHPRDFRQRHRVLYYLSLSELLPSQTNDDENIETTPLELYIDVESRNWAQEFLRNLHVEGPIIGLHAGASYGPSKRWPPQRFIACLRTLARDKVSFTVLILGGPAETSNAALIQEGLQESAIPTINGVGATKSTEDLAALVGEIDVFLSTDSGPMHVAAALERPQVAVFTSTSPNFTRPWNSRARVIEAKLACSPCFGRSCKQVPAGETTFPCHEAIDEKRVVAALADCLKETAARQDSR